MLSWSKSAPPPVAELDRWLHWMVGESCVRLGRLEGDTLQCTTLSLQLQWGGLGFCGGCYGGSSSPSGCGKAETRDLQARDLIAGKSAWGEGS